MVSLPGNKLVQFESESRFFIDGLKGAVTFQTNAYVAQHLVSILQCRADVIPVALFQCCQAGVRQFKSKRMNVGVPEQRVRNIGLLFGRAAAHEHHAHGQKTAPPFHVGLGQMTTLKIRESCSPTINFTVVHSTRTSSSSWPEPAMKSQTVRFSFAGPLILIWPDFIPA